jgi:hypothetical protein
VKKLINRKPCLEYLMGRDYLEDLSVDESSVLVEITYMNLKWIQVVKVKVQC